MTPATRRHGHLGSILTAAAVAAVVLLQAHEAAAIPAFARKYNVDCQTCHSAPPYLNHVGRRFKEAGYRMPDENGVIDPDAQNMQKLNDVLSLEKMPALAARVSGEALQIGSEDGGDATFHEAPGAGLELLMAGSFGSWGSIFLEAEAEAEEGLGYGGAGRAGFHPSEQFNIIGGFSEPFEFDPYNSLKGGGHGLTLADKTPLSLASITGAVVAGDTQFIDIYGRADKIFYSVGLTGNPDDPSGEKARNITTHVVADVSDDISVGVFGIVSLKGDYAPDPEVPDVTIKASSIEGGADVNIDADLIHADGVFLMTRSKDEDANASATELGGFGEVFYTYMDGGRPLFMPLVRVDYTTANDHADSYVSAVVQGSSYIFENARVGAEASFDLVKPSGEDKSWSVGLLTDVLF